RVLHGPNHLAGKSLYRQARAACAKGAISPSSTRAQGTKRRYRRKGPPPIPLARDRALRRLRSPPDRGNSPARNVLPLYPENRPGALQTALFVGKLSGRAIGPLVPSVEVTA